ncbi:Sulfate permease [hydrothermal vent metagenome]|uniref:Sulfate permease n=1 Tax=hydrothermal vent metagenome TaxID=652676 RepID=A0A3B0S960_9ZZZZ
MSSVSPATGTEKTAAQAGLKPSLLILKDGYSFNQFRGDLFGGITAAVIALPLALAFGVASGAGAISGLYGAIAVGFFATIFGGTPAQISGPTGPMTVVMAVIVATHANNLPEAFAIVIAGGALQIMFGAMRIGKYITYTPYSVVSGFMTGIGVIIIIVQLLPFVGAPVATGGVIGALQALSALRLQDVQVGAAGIALAAIGMQIIWPKRLQRIFPAPLAALIAGTIVAALFFRNIPVIGAVPSGLPHIQLPMLALTAAPKILQAAFILALLGSIDSLLTSLIADSVTRKRHDPDMELIGQGIGNMAAGLIGGLPGAGATMRTLVNVRAGGRTPVSGAIHALVLLSIALGLGSLVAQVPQAVLAAILLKVGWDIIDWRYLKRMQSAPREKFIVMLITFALTVFVDLITAVGVGIILASFVNAKGLAEHQLKGVGVAGADGAGFLDEEERAILRAAGGRIIVTSLSGSFSYASARDLARRASPELTGVDIVVYDFSNVGFIDTSAALAIEECVGLAYENGQKVFVSGLSGPVARALDGLGALDRVAPADRFASRRQAINAAAARLA